jgi:hypothetical protein
MAMAMVRRRIAGYAKVKRKRVPLPKKNSAAEEQMVGEAVRVYAPMAAVGRPLAQRSAWQRLWKPSVIGFGLLIGCIAAFMAMKSPARYSYAPAVERQDYPKTASVSASRIVGASSARRAQSGSGGTGYVGDDAVVLSNRSAPTDESFRAGAYIRQKVFLPNVSGECVVTGSGGDIGECLRQQAGK